MHPTVPQFDTETQAKMQQAKAAGYSDQEIMAKASQYQSQKSQIQPQTALPAQPKQDTTILDLLPLIGGVGGSFIPGLGTIAGGALGAGLGTLLKQFGEKKPLDVGEVAKESLLSGIGGAAGEGLGFIGGKLLGKVGGTIADAGENAGVRALRLNKGQLAGFLTKHGEDAGSFLAKEGALGKSAAQITAEHLDPLQEQFNAIAKNSGIQVNPNTFANNILDQYQSLVNAGGSENAKIADNLLKEADFVNSNSLNPSGHTIDTYNKLRQTFASKVNWANPEKAAQDYAMADALRKTVIDTADQAGMTGANGVGLKDIGIKLSKFRDLEKAATAQEQLGKGNLPAGITKWLSVLGGAGIGGPAGGAAGFAVNNIVNSPEFLRLIASGAVKGGDALAQGVPSSLGTQLAGRTTAQAAVHAPDVIGAMGGASPDQGGSLDTSNAIEGQYSPSNSPIPQPTATTASTYVPGMGNVTSKDLALRQILAQIMFRKARSTQDVQAAYDFLNPGAAIAAKPLTSQQQVIQANAQSGLRALDTVQTIIQKDPTAPFTSHIPILQGRSPYAAAAREVSDVLTRLRTGAALNKDEQAFYEKQLPQAFDTPTVINYKLSIFRNLFSRFANGQVPASDSIPQPSSASY